MKTEKQVEEALQELLESGEEYQFGGVEISRIESFENSGLLTRDRGLVVKLADGTEIQLTIQSYREDEDGYKRMLPSEEDEDGEEGETADEELARLNGLGVRGM